MINKKIKYNNNLHNKINLIEIYQNNGCTLDKKGNKKEYKKGYSVSVCDLYKINIKHKNKIKNNIIKAIKNEKKFYNIGCWIDNNLFYIDYSINIRNKQTALKIAKKYNQLSIYDHAKNNCIYLKNAVKI